MEWVGVFIWVFLLALALPLAGAGGLTAPSLATQAFLVVAGFGFCILYMATGGHRWMAWVSCGLALAATFLVARGAQVLMSDEPRMTSAGQAAEERAGLLAGLTLPLLPTAAFAMGLAAVGVTTVGGAPLG
jgi:hypothetical protein